MNLKKIYIKLYIACYCRILARNPNDEYNKANAVYFLSFLMTLKATCLPALASLFSGYDFYYFYSSSTFPAVGLAIFIMLLNFFCVYFLWGKSIQSEINTVDVNSDILKITLNFYVIFSVFFPIGLFVFYLLRNKV